MRPIPLLQLEYPCVQHKTENGQAVASSAKVKETIQLYLYSSFGPLCPVLEWPLPLPLPYSITAQNRISYMTHIHSLDKKEIIRLVRVIL